MFQCCGCGGRGVLLVVGLTASSGPEFGLVLSFVTLGGV